MSHQSNHDYFRIAVENCVSKFILVTFSEIVGLNIFLFEYFMGNLCPRTAVYRCVLPTLKNWSSIFSTNFPENDLDESNYLKVVNTYLHVLYFCTHNSLGSHLTPYQICYYWPRKKLCSGFKSNLGTPPSDFSNSLFSSNLK